MKSYTIISIVLTIAGIFLATQGATWVALLCGTVAILFMIKSYLALKKSQQNIITILKAIENSDHSFYFKESSGSERNKDFNHTLNKIKELIQRTQDEVRDHERFLAQIIEQVPTGIIITSPEGTIRFINHSALSYLSLPVVTHLHRIRQVYPELYSTIVEMKENESKSVSIQTEKEIQELVVEKNTTELAYETAIIITLNDINSELEERETDSWISLIRVMTHEIMNSIAPIRSISETLLNNPEGHDEVTRQAVQTIHNTSEHLITFVDNYRKFTSVPQPHTETIDIHELLNQATLLIQEEVLKKQIKLSVHLNQDIQQIEADRSLLMQVLQNILKNAAEATEDGGEIIISSDHTNNKRPLLKIYNSGAPIPEEIKEYIFIPFFTTKENGNGIGLSLSRYIMRLHGGNLRYNAQPHGNTFTIEF